MTMNTSRLMQTTTLTPFASEGLPECGKPSGKSRNREKRRCGSIVGIQAIRPNELSQTAGQPSGGYALLRPVLADALARRPH